MITLHHIRCMSSSHFAQFCFSHRQQSRPRGVRTVNGERDISNLNHSCTQGTNYTSFLPSSLPPSLLCTSLLPFLPPSLHSSLPHLSYRSPLTTRWRSPFITSNASLWSSESMVRFFACAAYLLSTESPLLLFTYSLFSSSYFTLSLSPFPFCFHTRTQSSNMQTAC